MKDGLKRTIKSALLPIVRPVWRRIWYRLEKRLEAQLEARLSPIENRIAAIESRVAPLDQGWNTHLPAFLNAVGAVGAYGHRLSVLTHEVKQLSAQTPQELKEISNHIPRLWDRIEFVRREIMFELAHGRSSDALSIHSKTGREPNILNRKKVEAAIAAGNVRLNLGCGHVALPDYLNVDMRELPGVDIVAEVDKLPFDAGSVSEIFSAHLVEHFSQEAMRLRLLPYWISLLKPGGKFQAITPDAAAMLKAAATKDYVFEDFREVLFGAQDYEGDYHYNLFTPDSMTKLLTEAGLSEVIVPVAGRRNGKCYEFEITGRRS